jgi:hypothetical protein
MVAAAFGCMDSSSSSHTTGRPLSLRLESFFSTRAQTESSSSGNSGSHSAVMKRGGDMNMGGSARVLHTRAPTLPRQLRCSSAQMPSAPLLRYPSHFRSQSVAGRSNDFPPSPASCSRPPSPMLNALHEALTESILPSPPPPARLPSSLSAPHVLSRPPPLLSSIRYTYPTASLSATYDTPLGMPHSTFTASPSLLSTPHISPTHSTTSSSLDTLRSIHTSAPAPITSSPSLGRWWFQSDPDAASKESVAAVLDEDDLLNGKLGKKCTSRSRSIQTIRPTS